MPYFTRTEIRIIVDDEDVTQYAPAPDDEIHQILKVARSYLQPLNYSTEDVLEGLEQAMRKGYGDFCNMHHKDFEEIFAHLSKQFPEIVFGLRCVGSQFKDVYLREFNSGKTSLSIGPFEA